MPQCEEEYKKGRGRVTEAAHHGVKKGQEMGEGGRQELPNIEGRHKRTGKGGARSCPPWRGGGGTRGWAREGVGSCPQ
jgi:hypothetical protein